MHTQGLPPDACSLIVSLDGVNKRCVEQLFIVLYRLELLLDVTDNGIELIDEDLVVNTT